MLQLSFFENKETHMVIIFLPTEDGDGLCKFDRKEMTKEEILNTFETAEKVTKDTYTFSAHKNGKEYLIRLGNCRTRKNDNINKYLERCWNQNESTLLCLLSIQKRLLKQTNCRKD